MSGAPGAELQRYLPRLVLAWQRDEPDELVKQVEGSLVFADVSGFTRMSERLARFGKAGAEEVTDVIAETFGALLVEAYACGGSLLKFGGDSLLLFFSGAGHQLRAVSAAHTMRAELRRIGRFHTTAGSVTLRMSVGAHAGLLHFFLVGGSHRELIVAGPAATVTTAMETAASAGQIVLSEELATALPPANRGVRTGPGILLRGAPAGAERSPMELARTDLDLSPYIPIGLRELVLAGRVEPEHRSVTIAFVQFSGLDELIERSGAPRAAQALDALVRDVQHAVDGRHVVFLASDISPGGGKIILAAGAPQVTGNDEESMLLALREIVSGDRELSLRIGVNKGAVFSGEIGPSFRRTFTVMGDAVNLAARLLARAEPGEILATPAVLEGSRTLFETAELEPFAVKGKRALVGAAAVGRAVGSRHSLADAHLPLIGRDRELRQLREAWAGACAGSGAFIEIVADPGLGKSRLLEELLVDTGPAHVLQCECRLYQSATPYFPFRSLLRAAFGLGELDDRAAAAALETLVSERAPHLAKWLALIGVPLDLEIDPSPEIEQLEERFRKTRLEEAVDGLLRVAVTEPTVVVVEDTHWIDEASRDLLARVAGSLRDRPWLVVVSRRPEEEGEEDAQQAPLRIELQPLSVQQAAALIESATAAAPLRPQQVRALAERAEGSPLFLLELLDALRRGEDVATLPRSVEGLIQARIDRLPPDDRRRLRELSVLGNGFRVEHAPVVLTGLTPEPAARTLRRLGGFLAVDRDGWVRFRHALIRDAAYEGLSYRTRRQLHAQIGDSILAAAGTEPEDVAELLSLHYSNAGRWPEAWAYSSLAGDRAREVHANLEAETFYERALSSAARLDTVDDRALAIVATRLCEVREHAGLFDGALDALRRARKLVGTEPVALADLHVRRARVLTRTGHLRAAYRETTRGYRLVETLSGAHAAAARARLSVYGSNILLAEGRPREAAVLAERAVGEAKAAGDRKELALAYVILDDAYLDLGRPEQAVYARTALEIYEQLGDVAGVAKVENSIGVRAYSEGAWDEALGAYTRSREAYERAGNEAHAATAAANIGEVLVSQRRFEQAEPILREAIRVQRAHGLAYAALFAEIQLGRLHVERGDLDAAVELLAQTHTEAIAMGIRVLAIEASVHLASARVRRGEAPLALELLDELERRPDDLVALFGAAIARARAEALLTLGRLEESAASVEAGLVSARSHALPYDEAQLLLLRAEVVARGGPSADVAAEVLEGQRLLQHLGVVDHPTVRYPSTLE